jgi:indolepyruvate ferredoxin oxidoreductase
LHGEFAGVERLEFHLVPPLFGRRDPSTGHLIKRRYGGWMLPVLRVLSALRFLRNTPLDPFARTPERRDERALVAGYEATIEELLERLSPETLPVAVALAALPERIRGFGHVRERSMRLVEAERVRLLERLRAPIRAMAAE